ncbi:MAG: hypothetical protein AAB654_01060 [Acidobacteriota bacterium]
MNDLYNPLSPEPELTPMSGAGWSMRCRVRNKSLSLRLTNCSNRVILRAKLPTFSHDPDALGLLFEMLARYSGRRLGAVVAAAGHSVSTFESVFIDQAPQMGSTRWVNLQFDVPAYGLVPCPFAANNQLTLDFDAVEF